MRVRDERGEAMAQTVIVAPALFMMIMAIVQFALVAHAQNVAEAAAQEGVAAARLFQATEADGIAHASAALSHLGPRMLTSRNVSVDLTPTTATVTVSGTALSLVPFLHPTVSQTASAAVERYVEPEVAGQ